MLIIKKTILLNKNNTLFFPYRKMSQNPNSMKTLRTNLVCFFSIWRFYLPCSHSTLKGSVIYLLRVINLEMPLNFSILEFVISSILFNII